MSEYKQRVGRLQHKLQTGGFDGMVVTQNVDLYYLAGSMQTGYLIVPASGDPKFFVRRSVARAEEESAWPVEPLGSLREFAGQLGAAFPDLAAITGRSPVKLAAEFDVLPVQLFQRLQQSLAHVEWKDGSALIRETRMIKSPFEIEAIRSAARVINDAFEDAFGWLKPGMTELEAMSRMEYFVRERGHIGIMRLRGYNQEVITGMLGAGDAAATPTYFDGPAGGLGLSAASPQSSSRRPFETNEPILMDVGCCIGGYVIDQTRTVVFGSLPDDLAYAYDASERILRSAEGLLRPGTVCEQLYAESLRLADDAGLADHYMGYGRDQVKFLGHGIGLEVDELPVLARGFNYPLEAGMVIAVEPKFTFPGRGVVGIENSYAITADGFEKLTISREGLIRL
ncbi:MULTISPECIES: M24 family metallopeptidase [Paenibacillus]|uniref:M24 family metallopeptidase n=1 Tax=Paenibacillus TaxID=44249 RepID=UPI000FD863F3|nr:MULTISPECIES: Xaa-Pro peptidase family protein [Paenibacillus]